MTEFSYPFGGQGPTSNPDWSDLMRDALPTGVVARSSNDLLVFGDSTGRQVKVMPGRANVRGHRYRSDSQITVPLDANTSGQPRKDLIVLRLEYGATNTVRLRVKTGVPALDPQETTLVQTDNGIYEEALGVATVANGAVTIAAANVADRRQFTAARQPAGAVEMFAGAVIPGGWLLCNGDTVPRALYPALYAALGGASSPFGQGDGSTTFNLPNFRGRTPVGMNTAEAEFDALGKKGGAKTHTLTVAQMPAHSHLENVAAGVASGYNGRFSYSGEGNGGVFPTNHHTNAAGGGQPHNNLQPYLALHFIIKA
ncbi:phage tail protein [Agromyces badenianii]|uniref:phage tail protein n=1 Tax=Agromyces badenianii TaxID=2080742 RepID=UPI000D59012C|nr:tail fiber protein [Agromyces badenianii]PWC05415.1 hypothetical protein DCE94_03845 [Agromyces badenianii]